MQAEEKPKKIKNPFFNEAIGVKFQREGIPKSLMELNKEKWGKNGDLP